jgi:hypothetical protein
VGRHIIQIWTKSQNIFIECAAYIFISNIFLQSVTFNILFVLDGLVMSKIYIIIYGRGTNKIVYIYLNSDEIEYYNENCLQKMFIIYGN